jgi:hypothetical protein
VADTEQPKVLSNVHVSFRSIFCWLESWANDSIRMSE